jgi:capsular polysaccharide biosynthesis protein
MRARWLMCDDFPEVLPVAATFVDACAFNYAHWVTEVLPRVAAFCSCDQFKDVPLIVDAGLHANIMESLFLVTGGEREIVLLPIGRAIKVRTLYVTSVAGYVPFERRNNKIAGHSHGLCSPWAFGLVRQHLFKFVESSPRRKWPKKIYLRRNSDVRKIVNSSEIEKLLINDGYKIYETEKMSFLDQVRLFSNIKFLVGSSGAALANIIFVSSDCQITVLMGTHPDTSYWYWQNMACASGNSVNYILGQRIRGNGIHADFEIDVNKLVQGLR